MGDIDLMDVHAVAIGAHDSGALFIAVEDGLWTHIRAQPLDQAAFDAFWA